MQHVDRIIGRDRELAQLSVALGDGVDGLRLATLTGPSGLGKTTLLGAAVQSARDRNFRSITVDGRAGTLSTPFAPWLDALPELAPIINHQAGAAQADMEQVGIALISLLSELSTAQPLLLTFDDAQALDESSIALLGYAAGIAEDSNISLLIVEQTDAVGVSSSYRATVDGLIARRIVNRTELQPLADDAVRELVAASLAISVEEVPAEIILRAQGNPWFAKELAASFEAGASEIPTSIAAAATSRLHSLSELAQDLVLAIALCNDGAHVSWLEGLADERPRAFVRTYEAITNSGLVREDHDVLSIAHPLMQQALIEEMSAAMRRALHLEIADVAAKTPTGEVAGLRAQGYHLSKGGKLDEAVACFVRAAEANEVQGQLHEGAADYVRALDAEPRIDHRMQLLKRCAYANMEIGNEKAVEYWNELGRIAAAQDDNETYAYALFQQYWASFDGTALDRLKRAAALGARDYGWAARAAACLCTLEGDYAAAIECDRRALELAREREDAMLEAMVLDKLGTCLGLMGEVEESIAYLEAAVAQSVKHRFHGWALTAWTNLGESLLDDLQTERAVQECSAAAKYVDDLSLEKFRPLVRVFRGRAYACAGKLEQATDDVEAAYLAASSERGQFGASIALIRAIVATDVGDVTRARPAVEIAIQRAGEHGFASFVFESAFTHARLAALAGDLDGAIGEWDVLTAEEPTSQAQAALWLARLGVRADRSDLVDKAVAGVAGMAPDSKLAQLSIDEIDAIAAAFRDGSTDLLEGLIQRWSASRRLLDQLRCQTSLALIVLKNGDKRAALTQLKEIKTKLATIGAIADADFVTSHLRSLGARSRAKSRMTKTGGLTKRELQISRLVASGMRNAEVAQQLFLAEKTVAAHLSNIYGKVGVNSRVQLASWLQANDADVEQPTTVAS